MKWVVHQVPDDEVGSFIVAVNGVSPNISLVKVVEPAQPKVESRPQTSIPVQMPTPIAAPIKKQMRYRNGKRNKGVASGEVFMESLLASGPKTKEQLENFFEAQGYAPKSAGPTISKLLGKGNVEWRGNYLTWIKSVIMITNGNAH